MKSTDLIGFAIAASVLFIEYLIARKIIVRNWFVKILLSVLVPLAILGTTCALRPMNYTLGLISLICLLSIPLLLIAISVKKKGLLGFSILHEGDTISFTGRVYGSVGCQYDLLFDKSAFIEEIHCKDLYKPRSCDYHKDEQTGEMIFQRPDGADEMEVTHILTAKREGKYEIEEIVEFRGAVESRTVHKILVK